MTQPRPIRVFSVAYFGVGNLGDETILTAIEDSLAATDAVIDRFAVRRGGFYRDRRAVRLSVGGFVRYAGAVRRADRVVLGGGGILKDEGFRILVDLLFTAVLARTLRKPVALLAVGVGPLRSRTGRVLVRSIAALCTVRTVRDAESAQLLGELGIDGVAVVPDPVFALTPREPMSPARAGVLISLRPWFFQPGMGRRRAEFVSRSVVALRAILAGGQAGRLVALYWPRDREFSAEIRNALPGASQPDLFDEPLTWPELLTLAAQSQTAVAMRFHAVVACLMVGTPVVAISYEPKVQSLAERFGLPNIAPGDDNLAAGLVALHDSLKSAAPGAQAPREVLLGMRDAARNAIHEAVGIGGAR